MKETRLKLITALLLCCAGFIIFDTLTSMPTYKYRIISENQGYRTNKYEVVSPDCVTFVDAHNRTVTVCGNYEIIENK